MEFHNPAEIATSLSLLKISPAVTAAEAKASVREFGRFEGCRVGVIHFSGLTPWERHPQDELLYVLEGAVEVTVLVNGETESFVVGPGSVCIIPKGLWHRQLPQPAVKLMFITGKEEVSFEDRPSESFIRRLISIVKWRYSRVAKA